VIPIVFLLLALGVAALAYRESESFKHKNGLTPWRIPSWVWAIIGFASLIVCAVLLAIARRTTKPLWTEQSWWPQSAVQTAVQPYTGVLPGWHPDPSGRYQFRYWSGNRWTEHVSSGGAAAIDPV
jgi:hypothetical protein